MRATFAAFTRYRFGASVIQIAFTTRPRRWYNI